MGARRRSEAPGIRARPRRTNSSFSICGAGENCLEATRGVDEVYALAADMGGMGFISSHHAQILHNNILISTHTLDAARENGVRRYLYTSSACVYPEYRQLETNVEPLREERCLPGRAAGRVRMGEAHHRAALRPLPRRLWARDAHRPLPQHLRTVGNLGRRPGESAGGPVPEGGHREADGQSGNRDLGRRRADPFVLLHRRLRRRASSA